MARVINQNNEVIQTKNTNKSQTTKETKTAISKTSLIVGIVLFLALITVVIVLVLVFTKKAKGNDDHIPTQLEQYIINYQKETKKDMKIQILKGLETQYVEKFTGECYVIVYNMNWMSEEDSSSKNYGVLQNFDAALTGGTTTTGNKANSFLDAVVNCGEDIKVFVIDYNSVKGSDKEENKPYFQTVDGEKVELSGAPEFYHLNYTNTKGDHEVVTRLYDTSKKGYMLYSLVNAETNRLNQKGEKN